MVLRLWSLLSGFMWLFLIYGDNNGFDLSLVNPSPCHSVCIPPPSPCVCLSPEVYSSPLYPPASIRIRCLIHS